MTIFATARPDAPEIEGWVCSRCGHIVPSLKPHASTLCPDCRLEPNPRRHILYVVNGETMHCRSWPGDYDENDNPILPDGRLYLPGERACGHKDCVNTTHIVGGLSRGSTLGADDVIKIRHRRASGEQLATLAAEYGVHVNTIRSICRGKSYANVGGPTVG
jgi:hypothetical protein